MKKFIGSFNHKVELYSYCCHIKHYKIKQKYIAFRNRIFSLFYRYALHFLLQSGITYGIMILTGVEHMHK